MIACCQVHSVEGTAFSCKFASCILPFIRLFKSAADKVEKATDNVTDSAPSLDDRTGTVFSLQVAGMPPKDAKQQKEKEAFANQEALQGLAARESQHRQLAAIRLELERLRLLLERVSKRERLKRESEQPTCLHFISCP